MPPFVLLEHTADMGIEATAESWRALLAEAARGLRAMISTAPCGESLEEEVTIRGCDREELMVSWLNEIIYLLEIRRLFPARFEVEEASDSALRGRVWGEPFDPQRHAVEREVKAATYHRLLVAEEGGRWRARIYVDL